MLRLYPSAWRRRYGREVEALLADRQPGVRDHLDLLGGALDAHLHPWWTPGWPVVTAATGGVAWTFAGAVALGQPVPADWPGYLADTLPLLLAATPLLLLATLGASARLADRDPMPVVTGRLVAVLGFGAWILVLAAAVAGLAGGAPLALASTGASAGMLLVGSALLGAGDRPIGAALLIGGLAIIVPLSASHLAFGIAWTVVALAELRDPRPRPRPTRRPA